MNRLTKRALTALLAAVIAISASGCGGRSIPEADSLTTGDVALLDEDGDIVLEYRMTRADAERAMGAPDSDGDELYNEAKYGETLIRYTDEEDYGLSVIDPVGAYQLATITEITTSDQRYETARGISVGDSVDDVLEAYGAPVDALGNPLEGDDLEEMLGDDDMPLYYMSEYPERVVGLYFEKEGGDVTSIYMSVLEEAQNEGHGGNAQESDIPMSELAITDAAGTFSAEMNTAKSEFEQAVGAPNRESGDMAHYRDSALTVSYTDGIATSMTVFGEEIYTRAGIHPGSTREDIIDAYGTPDPGRGESIAYTRTAEDGTHYALNFGLEDGVCSYFTMSVYDW